MPGYTHSPRFDHLPVVVALGREVGVAYGFRVRLLGLAGLERAEAGAGLLIPRCSCVHTFGMRFDLDLHFLDGAGDLIASRLAVPPKRVAFCGGASAVLELPAGTGGDFAQPPA